ncbi:uncharacterized protein [Ptychodera flava]|uniref:uncharacterized protein n=1 Tax=Ptychodera flava TaxID=63121 RepID=UPI003969C588
MAQIYQSTPLAHLHGKTPARQLRQTRFNNVENGKKHSDEKIVRTPMNRQPLTPMCAFTDLNSELPAALKNIRKRIDQSDVTEDETAEKISPSLARLRMTPGRALQKQKILERKHHEAKSKVEKLNVGGGVSIWPEMDNMRLVKSEVYLLFGVSVALVISVCSLFRVLHGELKEKLDYYASRLNTFWNDHKLETRSQEALNSTVLKWHTDFTNLMDDIHHDFDTRWSRAPITYYISVFLYISGIATLLYYLVDNMFAKSKLTPRRIKVWVSLLVVMGCWSVLIIGLLSHAQSVEFAIESNIHKLSNSLGDLVYLNFDLSHFNNVLLYWRIRCLPPTTVGTLSIMGLLQVRDVMYYLQYYSLPVITALCTPVVRLIMALKEIYSVK